jgi:hypothetical protein
LNAKEFSRDFIFFLLEAFGYTNRSGESKLSQTQAQKKGSHRWLPFWFYDSAMG